MAAAGASVFVFLLVVLVHCSAAAVEDSYNSSEALRTMQWGNARATWYGQPNGAGPDDNGGACGFKNVNQYPFMSMTSCGNQPLFKDGKGCGSCYKVERKDLKVKNILLLQIKCTRHAACSGRTETVMITDMNYYPVAPYHFDLSGTAFGKLAKPGRNNELRHAGIIDIQFARLVSTLRKVRTRCTWPVLIEYENGDGDVVQVDLKEARSQAWTPMRESWGSVWRLDSNHRLRPPFSIRIRSDSGKTLVARDVIPINWRPNTTYRSFIQYS
ncbi:hypothetical protein PR202_gb18277 [Eleusine coracana subsp. coracana]|uniref:Uncharacterized protein n=1 Tax=Eleusine coracana subsp. coracana TaxID=191504 RepID=A0AAV5F531_ELECO|nr:hypothetical protein PR202_gb18277 [Eleusine coracana subsp. coracana]